MTPVDRARLATLAARPSFHKGRYRNPDRTPRHGLRSFLRWQRETGGRFPPGQPFPLAMPDSALLTSPATRPRLTWIGHASFLFQYRDISLLTDPVFARRASPVQWAGPKRFTPPALTAETVPPINQVLISHNHYDHLDRDTVLALHRRFGRDITWFVPEGVGAWFRRRGIDNLVERGWWQSAPHQAGEAFFVPAQHFSGRGAHDSNRTLWGGWVMDIHDVRLYFAGDTGYGSCFAEIGEVFGEIDLALIPIGAYAPRWFMGPVHVDPDDAVQIHQDVCARTSVAMHWGTFVLTDEPMDEPPRRLAQARAAAGLPDEAFRVLGHGDTLTL
ncbi:MBL fold metallo-hydrolase [Isoalcanivorax indicus]|uniref:MBL fold metallo-hydrolase n=1 Tax=Isoalcanivorax indicus TaxID=2202653 RepID=UPI000DBA3BB4|nr:MBL fold metallo-hydrolase [Isoalcanivorax indicus]